MWLLAGIGLVVGPNREPGAGSCPHVSARLAPVTKFARGPQVIAGAGELI